MIDDKLILTNLSNITTDKVDLPDLAHRGITLHVLRLDKIHPVISGNKWFKLKGHFKIAALRFASSLITFGGAWSNHIVAAAYAARAAGLPIKGIIRGERPDKLSATLQEAEVYGMELEFITRIAYRKKEDPLYLSGLVEKHPGAYIIPEGGAGAAGSAGSEEIVQLAGHPPYSHILCAVGTGTMLSGLIQSAGPDQIVIGMPVLKGINDLSAILQAPLPKPEKLKNCQLINSWHFGGYARKTTELLRFMNRFYRDTGIPSDFVYTGKLFYGTLEMIRQDLFPPGSRLLVIHSGGLQGNQSLSPGTLDF